MPGGDTPGTVVGYEPQAYRRVDRIDYRGAPVASVLSGLARGGIVPAKSYAEARGLRVGDRVRIEGPSGVRTAPVVGIADTLDAGGQTVQMSLGSLAAIYGIRTGSQLLIKAALRASAPRGAVERGDQEEHHRRDQPAVRVL